jgi:hypothetical protein
MIVILEEYPLSLAGVNVGHGFNHISFILSAPRRSRRGRRSTASRSLGLGPPSSAFA